MTTRQVQAATQRFREVLRAAEAGDPQFLTEHGTPVAVVLGIEEYRRLRTPRPPLNEFLLSTLSGLGVGKGLDLPSRTADPLRFPDLFEDGG